MNPITKQIEQFFADYRKEYKLKDEFVADGMIIQHLAVKVLQIKFRFIYDILIAGCGANADDKENFIYNHVHTDTTEWRFQGKLGFGGKYRSRTNTIDCYSEDMNPEREKLIKEINEMLAKLNNPL